MEIPEQEAKPEEGLRERKRRQTRERIANVALALFLERGFEATTIDEIAAAADVSKRSFFDYFPAKEDVVSAWQDRFGERLTEAVLARPADEPLTRVIEEAMTALIAAAAADPQALAIGNLIHETPALRARDHLKYAKLEQTLAEALALRASNDAGRLKNRLMAMVVVGAMRVGGECWRADQPAEGIESYARRIFATIWSGLHEFGEESAHRTR